MKIEINQIPPQGLVLEESITASELDLSIDEELFKLTGPINIKANISKVTNVVTVAVELVGSMKMTCSRCLDEFEVDFKKNLMFNYPVDKLQREIDITDDMREEVILGYPMKPLCSPDCKGICPKCGENLNAGKCKCHK